MGDWIALAVIVACSAFMYWQAHRTGRDADRVEAALREVKAAERHTLAAQEATRTVHATVAGLAVAIGHDADIVASRTTGRTVYSYGPDGEIKGDGRE